MSDVPKEARLSIWTDYLTRELRIALTHYLMAYEV